MLDLVFRTTFRNYSTFFLIAATISLPLYLAYSFAYQDVIATSAIHDDIAQLEADEKVQGVGPSNLDSARLAALAVNVLGAALVPLLAAAAVGVLVQDEGGRVPGAWRAWSHAGGAGLLKGLRSEPAVLAGGVILAISVGALASLSGHLLLELVGASRSWAGVGSVQGLSLAAAAPFIMAPWALVSIRAKGTSPLTPNLY